MSYQERLTGLARAVKSKMGPSTQQQQQQQRDLSQHPQTIPPSEKPESDSSSSPDRLDRGIVGQTQRKKYTRYECWNKITSKAFTFVFTAIMFSIMAWIVSVHERTLSVFRAGRNPWPQGMPTKVWPTYLLMAASGVSMVLALGTLVLYIFAFERAVRSWKLTLVKNASGVVVWIVVSVLYRTERGSNGVNNDLWGWACSPEAQAIQDRFEDVVGFRPLCRAQTGSWAFSLLEFSFRIIFAVSQFWIHRKTGEGEKKLFADRAGSAVGDLFASIF